MGEIQYTYSLLELGVGAALNQGVSKAEHTTKLLVAVGEVHGGEPCKSLMLSIHSRHGEVSAQLQRTLLGLVIKGAQICGTADELSAFELDGHGKNVRTSALNRGCSLFSLRRRCGSVDHKEMESLLERGGTILKFVCLHGVLAGNNLTSDDRLDVSWDDGENTAGVCLCESPTDVVYQRCHSSVGRQQGARCGVDLEETLLEWLEVDGADLPVEQVHGGIEAACCRVIGCKW